MKRVPVGDLRRNASALIRELEERGGSFEITRRGCPVARLVATTDQRPGAELAIDGVLPPTRPWNPPEPLEPVPGVLLPSELLARLRGDER